METFCVRFKHNGSIFDPIIESMFDLLIKKWKTNTGFISDPFIIQNEGRLDPFYDPKTENTFLAKRN
jgi:hypothetical protein